MQITNSNDVFLLQSFIFTASKCLPILSFLPFHPFFFPFFYSCLQRCFPVFHEIHFFKMNSMPYIFALFYHSKEIKIHTYVIIIIIEENHDLWLRATLKHTVTVSTLPIATAAITDMHNKKKWKWLAQSDNELSYFYTLHGRVMRCYSSSSYFPSFISCVSTTQNTLI